MSLVMDTLPLSTLLSGATLAAVLWLFRTAQQLREDHAVLRTILTGEKGDNGVNGEVKALRARSHIQGDAIHVLAGRVEVHAIQIEGLERRIGPDDRRAH